MNCAQAKAIGITSLLGSIGMIPVRQDQHRMYYHSPFSCSGDRHPSLQVTLGGRCFYDWSTGRYGDIIDLAKYLCGSESTSEALRYIEACVGKVSNTFAASMKTAQSINLCNKTSGIVIDNDIPIMTKLLAGYAWGRGIHRNVLAEYCREIHYHFPDKPEKRFYALGWRNRSRGYELRSRIAKISTAPKDISIVNDLARCPFLIFEGFFDFLAAIELQLFDANAMNAIVLNSTALVRTAILALQDFSPTSVKCLLDQDEAGRNATCAILTSCSVAKDCSFFYQANKDLNEWLMAKRAKNRAIK